MRTRKEIVVESKANKKPLVNEKNTKIKIVIDNLYDEEDGLKIDDDIIIGKFEETITNENCSLNEPTTYAPNTPSNRFDRLSQKSNITPSNKNETTSKFIFSWGSFLNNNFGDGKSKNFSNSSKRFGSSEIRSKNPIAYL